MSQAPRFLPYSAEILSFSLEGDHAAPLPEPPLPDKLETLASRCLKAWERQRPPHLFLAGLGSGALASRLTALLPGGADLTVCELNPHRASVFLRRRASGDPAPGFDLMADTSAWAHICLAGMYGLNRDNSLMLANPELDPGEKRELKTLLTLFQQSEPITLPMVRPEGASISFGAILHPGEPMLTDFLDQIPSWVAEAVLVWDADEIPDIPAPSHAPDLKIRHIASRLTSGFHTQRNIMREACTKDWIFTLDGDELLPPEQWARIPALTRLPGVNGVHFPRRTFFPDHSRVRSGFGLWPDLQLRLFRNTEAVEYVRPVHERLTGLAGRQALALDLSIEHHSHLLKSREELEEKLKRFDRASGGMVRHTLNREYPGVPDTIVYPDFAGKNGINLLVLPQSLA